VNSKLLHTLRRLLGRNQPSIGPLADTLATGSAQAPRLLILSSTKRNQNYYRDMELAQQTRSLFLGENFDWATWGNDVARVAANFFPEGKPDAVFLNYNHHYTHQLRGLNELGVPVFGFVGDHYDFTDDSPRARVKQDFFRGLTHLVAMVSAYPHTSAVVAQALGRPELPFIYLPWAIDPRVFHNLGKRRRYDIACLGALTEGKYPFRRELRAWLEGQRQLRYIRKKRIGGHDGEMFNRALNTTRSAFTCASSMRYTLMKYFEIPASGALLFGETTPELTALGFRDGEHYVAVTPADFREKIIYYLYGAGRDQGEQIRCAGNRFVREQHTWERRIHALLQDLSLHLKNNA
jgi:Glycosyl transferases group 1